MLDIERQAELREDSMSTNSSKVYESQSLILKQNEDHRLWLK